MVPRPDKVQQPEPQGEAYWRERAEFLEEILHAIPDMVLVKAQHSKLVWANRAFQEFYAMDNDQLRNLIDSPVNEPDFTKQYVQDDKWVWENQALLKIACEPVVRFDGVERKFETYKTAILDEEGETKFSVGVSRDVTEKIEGEGRTESASKMAALGEMAGGIAHEINNPLAVIIGKARLTSDLLKQAGADPKALHNLDRILYSAERIMKIVAGLRSFSREGENDPFVEASVAGVVNETLAFCQSRIQHAGIALEVVPINETLKMRCRPVAISQILLNLLNNAYDAAKGSPSPWIKLFASETGGFVELRVWDSGPGVPDQIETKIMQPFFTTKEVGKGTGLGLSISSSLAKDHGGSLKLDRKVARSCFVLRIPVMR